MSAALIALALGAAAQDWERAGPSPGGAGYYDPASVVVIDSTRRRVRVRAAYDPIKQNGVASSIALVEIDCVNHTGTLIEIQHLDAAGNVLATQTVPPAERRAMPNPPRGPEEVILARICREPSA